MPENVDMAPGLRRPDLVRVLESAASLQAVVPDAVLVGGSAAALWANHRTSFDHDHVLADLNARFDTVLEAIAAIEGWGSTATESPIPGKSSPASTFTTRTSAVPTRRASQLSLPPSSPIPVRRTAVVERARQDACARARRDNGRGRRFRHPVRPVAVGFAAPTCPLKVSRRQSFVADTKFGCGGWRAAAGGRRRAVEDCPISTTCHHRTIDCGGPRHRPAVKRTWISPDEGAGVTRRRDEARAYLGQNEPVETLPRRRSGGPSLVLGPARVTF